MKIIVIILIAILSVSCKVKKDANDEYTSEIIDFENLPEGYFISNYDLLLISRENTFTGEDSFYVKKHPGGGVKLQGQFALDNKKKITDFAIGVVEEYFEGGNLKSKGKYEIGKYTQC